MKFSQSVLGEKVYIYRERGAKTQGKKEGHKSEETFNRKEERKFLQNRT